VGAWAGLAAGISVELFPDFCESFVLESTVLESVVLTGRFELAVTDEQFPCPLSAWDSFADKLACSSAAENDRGAALPAPAKSAEAVGAGGFPVAICGTMAITAFTDRTEQCKLESKISGLEKVPEIEPVGSQLKTFNDCAD